VVEDVRQSDLRTESHPELYLSFERQSWRRMHLVMRTDGDPAALLPAVAAALRAVDSGIHVEGPRVMTDIVQGTFSDARLLSSLLTLFGFVALGLGAVGVYGVAAQVVGERQREIGIRLALGAESAGVIARTVGQGLVPVIVGLGIGLAGAWGSTRIMSGLVFGVEPHDPWTFALAPAVLFIVALASLWIPARRAGHVDPVATLREE
jgi:putative ABC transport system permease protein